MKDFYRGGYLGKWKVRDLHKHMEQLGLSPCLLWAGFGGGLCIEWANSSFGSMLVIPSQHGMGYAGCTRTRCSGLRASKLHIPGKTEVEEKPMLQSPICSRVLIPQALLPPTRSTGTGSTTSRWASCISPSPGAWGWSRITVTLMLLQRPFVNTKWILSIWALLKNFPTIKTLLQQKLFFPLFFFNFFFPSLFKWFKEKMLYYITPVFLKYKKPPAREMLLSRCWYRWLWIRQCSLYPGQGGECASRCGLWWGKDALCPKCWRSWGIFLSFHICPFLLPRCPLLGMCYTQLDRQRALSAISGFPLL